MAGFNGKWTLKAVDNAAAFFDAVSKWELYSTCKDITLPEFGAIRNVFFTLHKTTNKSIVMKSKSPLA